MATAGWLACLGLACVLAFAGVAKLVARDLTAAAMVELLGLRSVQAGTAVAVGAAIVELAVAAGIVLQAPGAALAAALLLTGFAAVQGRVLAARGSGVRCGCLGPGSKVTTRSVAQGAALAGVAWALAFAVPHDVGTQLRGWSVAVVALAALAGALAIALDLARRLAALDLDDAPDGALELADEGPALGAIVALPRRAADAELPRSAEAELRLSVFVSPACALCTRLRPAIELFALRDDVDVVIYDEERDPDAWRLARVPGSPYALAHDANGTVLAKGAFNTMHQLESVCATALRRAGDAEIDVTAA